VSIVDHSSGFSSPLKGVRVLEISHVQAGPVCGMMLADMGAEVTKVESFAGDMFRHPLEGANFQNFNRNKRAIAVDLKTPEGLEIVLGLAKKSDVLIENFLPGALEKLGLGYEAVRQSNPGIVYGSISGFGLTGAMRHRPAVEPIVQAMSGIMEATGDADRSPVRVRPAMIDYCTGASMAFAIAAALFKRANVGHGEHIDIALFDIALYAMSPYITYYKKRGKLFPRTGSAHPATAPNQNFETNDGFICIVASTDRMWRNLCRALGLSQACSDPRFETQAMRVKHATELGEIVNRETKNHSGLALEGMLLAAGVPCGKVRSIAEILDEPYIEERGLLESSDHRVSDKLETLKTPIFLSGKPAPLRRRAPMLGENTEEILRELGYSAQRIDELVEHDVVLGLHNETAPPPASPT
jgi:formyl-CoA transferase/CoA:oxalate CoA-transferase